MLKCEFNRILSRDFLIERPVEYVMNLLEYADENYYHIYAFSEFMRETLENIGDKKYLVLWKIFDEMLYNPEMQKAGSVIFVPDEPGYEKQGLHYLGKQPKRRLLYSWDVIEDEKKQNKARVTLRRYMALIANKALRKKVLGF